MLTAVMIVGALLLVTVPLVAFGLVVWYGLSNPESGAGRWVYKWWPFGMPQSVQEDQKEKEEQVRETLHQATRVVPKDELLRKLRVGKFFTLMGEQVDLVGKMVLLELQFFGSDKSNKVHISPSGDKLREFPWFSLGDGRIITELPSGEGKRLNWYIGEDVTDQSEIAVAEFMGGSQSGSTGPAKRFAQSNQSADVRFEIPGIQGNWKCVDIVWVDTQIEGSNCLGNGARVAMVLARQTDGDDHLLFGDLRSGAGSDTLWRLRQFNPNVEFEEI